MTTAIKLDGPSVPPASGGAPTSIVIFLHGYGSNGADLISLAPYWRPALPHTLFLSPNAPQDCPGAPGGYQWWALSSLAPAARAEGVRQSAPAVQAFIDEQLTQYGLADDRVVLVGFSQGTMMALHVGPRRERPLAGIIGFSGMLADPDALKTEKKTTPPVLLVHGDADTVLPVDCLPMARDALMPLGFDVSTHISRGMGHSIDEAGLRLGGAFIAKHLA